MNVHNGIIHDSQKVETIQISNNEWISKQNVVYSYKKHYLAIKGNKVLISVTPWKYYPKCNKPDKKCYALYDFTYIKCLE